MKKVDESRMEHTENQTGGISMKEKWYIATMCLLVALCVISGYILFRYFAENKKHDGEFRHLAELIEPDGGKENDTKQDSEGGKPFPKDKYKKLHQKNKDMVGWIKIDGTSMDYPVMHTPDQPYYYLDHNFDRQYSTFGVPFLAGECDLKDSDNLIIYGHHISGGRMFGMLEYYKNKSYFDQHPIILFETLMERAEYQVIAVFKTVVYSDGGFPYYQFTKAANEEDYQSFIEKCKQLSFYDTGYTAAYKEKLLTLSTCEYSNRNGRLVVLAKRL